MKYKITLIHSLLIIVPILFFGIIHLTFAYANNSLDMSAWSEFSRHSAALFGLIVFVIGIILCILLWLDREKNDNN